MMSPNVTPHEADLSFTNHGSIFTMTVNTDAGQEWCDEHLPDDAMTFGGAIVIEHRYARDIADGAISDGLTID